MNATIRCLAIANTLILFATLSAFGQHRSFITQDAGPYWRVDVGSAIAQDNHLTDFAGLTSGNKIRYDVGFAFDAALGYAFNKWVAAELETGWTWNAIDSIQGLQVDDTSFSTIPIFANVVLQYPIPRTLVVPYIGAGVGGAATIFDTDGVFYQTGSGGLGFFGTSSDFVFAYQGFAGVRIQLNDQMQLGVGYKYLATDRSTFGEDTDYYYYYGPELHLGVSSQAIHMALLTFTFKF
jgi:opacity protein-like surface antigen